MSVPPVLDSEAVPAHEAYEQIDVRELPPPEPLQRTLERLESVDDGEILVQVNDRVPQHLFPMLEERGYAHETVDGDPVYTAIWKD